MPSAERNENINFCRSCSHILEPLMIEFMGVTYYVCLHCKRVHIDDMIRRGGIREARFKSKTKRKNTIEFYEKQISISVAHISSLGIGIDSALSQEACHFATSLSLILGAYLEEAAERIQRLKKR